MLKSYQSIHDDDGGAIDEQVGRIVAEAEAPTLFVNENIAETSPIGGQLARNTTPKRKKPQQLQQLPSKLEIPNYYHPKTALDQQRYWALTSSNGIVTCQIESTPIGNSSSAQPVQTRIWKEKSEKEQYVIHIHGLHHTGTGYLRQTLQQALNDEFAPNNDSPVASIHQGDFPYLQGLSSKKFLVPEDEGQHFQNVFPPYRHRVKLFRESMCSIYDFGRLFYLADECALSDKSSNSSDSNEQYSSSNMSYINNSRIGRVLLDEWLTFWNTSATFLIQKTPLLDVKFHESIKQLPTLHVIVVRHPMTSNTMKFSGVSLQWLDAFTHTLEILSKKEIDWYAVITFEALIHHHDQVVQELLEVVRSGMNRFGSKIVSERKRDQNSKHRRLPLHAVYATNFTGPLSYLVPKDDSISLWEKCLKAQTCKSLLEELSSDVFPYFGYVSMDWADLGEGIEEDEESEDEDGESLDVLDETSTDISDDYKYETPLKEDDKERSSPQLSSHPGLVTASKNFGRVLFSSEGDALRNFRKRVRDIDDEAVGSNPIGNNPLSELVSTMMKILTTYRKKYPKPTPARNKQVTSSKRYWTLEAFDGGTNIKCDVSANSSSVSSSGVSRMLEEKARNGTSFAIEPAPPTNISPSSQYIIHIHGLHHTGTGFLRQTMHESINEIYHGSSSMQEYSLFPYIYGSKGRLTAVPENEGQHLQTIFPSFTYRVNLKMGNNIGKLAYLTGYCKPKDESIGFHQIGDMLHHQWSKYWNTSATFLLQKSPTLDVEFLERTKVMPTLHLMIVRHPMTSNSWNTKWMGLAWLDAWAYTLDVLASGGIEWYAVVTYEALVQYHDTVVEELMEVVRSGMSRFSADVRATGGDKRVLTKLPRGRSPSTSHHRKLELHASNSTLLYLKPKDKSVALWKSCNVLQSCGSLLKALSSNILPLFGYTDAQGGSEKKGNTLTSSPGPKTVSKQFGHVLFSSEGVALRKFRQRRGADEENDEIGDPPSLALISAMKELFARSNRPKPKGGTQKAKSSQ